MWGYMILTIHLFKSLLKFQIMKKTIHLILILFLVTGCLTNIVTGRKQLNLVSESQLQMMAVDQYRSFLSEAIIKYISSLLLPLIFSHLASISVNLRKNGVLEIRSRSKTTTKTSISHQPRSRIRSNSAHRRI